MESDEEINSRIERRDGVGFRANKVVETIDGVGVDEAIADPLCGLDPTNETIRRKLFSQISRLTILGFRR